MPMNHSEMEQELRSLKEEVITLKTQIGEMQKSENRLFSLVVTVAFIMIAGSFWFNIKIYETDKWVLQDDLRKSVDNTRDTLVKDRNAAIENKFRVLETRISTANDEKLNGFRLDMSKDQPDSFAYTLGYVADIWLFMREVKPAIEAALEQFNQATQGRGSFHPALDKLIAAFTIATQDRKRIPDDVLSNQVLPLFDRPDVKNDDRGKRLKEAV
jgi:hypothetical protein